MKGRIAAFVRCMRRRARPSSRARAARAIVIIQLTMAEDKTAQSSSDGTTQSSSNIILPPPAIRAIVDKTAAFVAKSPHAASFEDKIKAREKSDSRFAFLNKEDAYHAYYQQRLEAFRAGESAATDSSTSGNKQDGINAGPSDKEASNEQHEDDGRPKQPPTLDFLVESPPPMNAVDL